jgi:hypothetical protein
VFDLGGETFDVSTLEISNGVFEVSVVTCFLLVIYCLKKSCYLVLYFHA